MLRVKKANKKGFSLLEVIVATSLLSIILVASVSFTTSLIKNMEYNKTKLYATRHLDDLKEFVDGERLSDWSSFSAKASVAGRKFCLNDLISDTTSMPSSSACNNFNGVINSVGPKIFKREVTLSGNINKVTATFEVSWQQGGKTYIEDTVTVYTQWQK